MFLPNRVLPLVSPIRGAPEPLLDVVVEQAQEISHDRVALQRELERTVDVHGRARLLGGARQRYADVGVLRLSRPVYNAPHHRDAQLLRAGIARLPGGPLIAQIHLDLLRHLLKERRGCATTPRACGDLWCEAANAE